MPEREQPNREMREIRIFTEEEIRAEIGRIDQIETSDLDVVNTIRNQEGEIVSMDLELKKEKAKEKFGDQVQYNFTLKGRHAQSVEASVTNISRHHLDESGEWSATDVADFKNGVWITKK